MLTYIFIYIEIFVQCGLVLYMMGTDGKILRKRCSEKIFTDLDIFPPGASSENIDSPNIRSNIQNSSIPFLNTLVKNISLKVQYFRLRFTNKFIYVDRERFVQHCYFKTQTIRST